MRAFTPKVYVALLKQQVISSIPAFRHFTVIEFPLKSVWQSHYVSITHGKNRQNVHQVN